MQKLNAHLPYKSVAGALLFTVILGPVGLLYASFWGGFSMILLGLVVVSSKFLFSILLLWLICCVWAVKAVEAHNRKISQVRQQHG
jgi:hypothetical protein